LAKLLGEQKKKHCWRVATSTDPPQLNSFATLARQLGVEMFASDPAQKPGEIAAGALDYARKHYQRRVDRGHCRSTGDR